MNDSQFTVNGTVRLRRPDDVLTAIPFLLGFIPDHCLVVLALSAGRLEVTARLDLPRPDQTTQAAACLSRSLSRTATTQLIVVGYGSADDVVPVLTGLTSCLTWPVLELLRVETDRWWSLTCQDHDCCPPGATLDPRDDIVAALIVSSGSPAASRNDRAAGLAPGPDELVGEVEAALALPDQTSTEDLYAAACQERATRTDRRSALGVETASTLLHAFRDTSVRDACCGWRDVGALNLWLDLLPMAPAGWVAPVATLLALTAYQRGDGALALLALQRATDDQPGYRLAALVDQLMAYGIPPNEITALLQHGLHDHPLCTTARPAPE